MQEYFNHVRENPSPERLEPGEEENIIEKALDVLHSRFHEPDFYVKQPSDLKNYFSLQLAQRKSESFCIMYLDNQHGFLGVIESFRGTIDGAGVHPREIVRACLHFNAAAVVFAHNHPSGLTEPSQADIRITSRLKSALDLVDVRVLDHFVIGSGPVYSFAEHGLV